MVTSTVTVVVTAWKEDEEDEKGKLKKSHFSKQVGFVLRENKLFLERKKRNSKLLGGEIGWFFFGRTKYFGVGRTKVGDLNLMMTRIFY